MHLTVAALGTMYIHRLMQTFSLVLRDTKMDMHIVKIGTCTELLAKLNMYTCQLYMVSGMLCPYSSARHRS